MNQSQVKGRILLIEDRDTEVSDITIFLKRRGYECMDAGDGKSGIEQARTLAPDLILLDIHMPGMDGFQTCHNLKADSLTREIPVIFITGFSVRPADKVRGFEAGGVDYLVKPFDFQELAARVHTHVQLYRLQRESRIKSEQLEREVAERKATEAALRKSEAWFRAIYEQAGMGIVQTDADGRILAINPAFARMIGYSARELAGRHWAEITEPADTEISDQTFKGLVSGQAQYAHLNKRYRRKNGEILWAALTLTQVKKPDGTLDFMLAMIEDITEQKQVQQALAESELRYQFLFENSLLGIGLASWEGTILDCNQAICRLLGYPRQELMRLRVPDMYARAADRNTFLDRLQKQGRVEGIELDLVRKDGRLLPVYLSAIRLPMSGGHAVLTSFIDLTERKKMEQQLIEANQRLEGALQAKSQFLARMSHEIRTPLNAIMGMTELCLRGEMALTPEQQEHLRAVRQSSTHLMELINDILDFSKIEAGKIRLESMDFDLRELLKGVVKGLELRAREKGLYLEKRCHPALTPYLKGDPTRLRQILINLLGNAVKFTSQGGVHLDIAPEPSRDPDRRCLRFSVTDTGPGMAPEKLESIFDSFSQGDDSVTREYGGTGLGLSICRQLVHLMGGRIWASSQPGQGSCFCFTADFAPGDPANIPDPSQEPETTAPPSSGLRVLVAEDIPLNAQVTQGFLQQMGHQSELAANGREAIDALLKDGYDLVLMDVQMPEMDGLEATRRIRAGEAGERNQAIPVVAMTAHVLTEYRQACLAAGMDGFLSKPIDFYQMRQVLAEQASAAPPLSPPRRSERRLLNEPALMQRLGGDPELLQQIYTMFLETAQTDTAELHAAVSRQDFDELARLAHTLKGQYATLSAETCQELAIRIEEAARSADLERISSGLQSLEKEVNRLTAWIRDRV